MSRRKTASELEELAKIKRAQTAARLAERTANPKPYTPKPDIDYTQVYYRNPLAITESLELKVANGTLELWGGVTAAGLTLAPAAGTSVIQITKGNKIPIVKVRWYYGDENVVVVPATEAHGRWIKFYDVKNGRSHHLIPFVKDGATPDLGSTITSFITKFDTEGETARILGQRGRAELIIGYGNQHTVLARVSV